VVLQCKERLAIVVPVLNKHVYHWHMGAVKT